MTIPMEDMGLLSLAADNPDVPYADYGLPDTPEYRAMLAKLKTESGTWLPNEWPSAGNADHLYSKDMSARALAASIYDDVDPVEKKVDATVLEAERMIALVDEVEPLDEFKRIYIRKPTGVFATVHEGGGSAYVERLGTNRHGSDWLEASDHALIQSHLSPASARMTYGEAYQRGHEARNNPDVTRSLGERHATMKKNTIAMRGLGAHRAVETEVLAHNILDSAGYIDGALGRKRKYRSTLIGSLGVGIERGLLGRVPEAFAKSLSPEEYDALSPEEKREFVRDDHGRFAHTPGAHMAIGDSVREHGGATLDIMTGSQPTKGYIVAVQGHNREIPEDEFFAHRAKLIADYVKANREHLAGTAKNPRMLGIWHDVKNHEVVFDVVEQHHDKNAAIQAGRERNQQAIWDVANAAEIDTGGTGDRAVKADEAGRPDPDAGEPGGDDGRGDRRLGGDGGGEDDGDPADFLTAEEKSELRRADPNS